MQSARTTIKAANNCLAKAREAAIISRNLYGPTNRELMKEITELKQMVADLKILVLTKQH